jgi:signal transduction histidine kinase
MSSQNKLPPNLHTPPLTSSEQRLGPLNPGQQDDVRALLVSHDEPTVQNIQSALRQVVGINTRILRAKDTDQALQIIQKSAPQVILLHVQRSLPATMYQLSKLWNADPSVAVLAFVEPIYRDHAEMLKEPGLDIITLDPILHEEMGWAIRHAHEWTSRRRLETHLTSRDRLAIAGQLAAGIVHDINNPLMAAKTNLDLALEALFSKEEPTKEDIQQLQESVADARTGVQVAQRIARDLTDFSRAPEDRHEPIDVCKVLQAALTLCAPQVRHKAKLIPHFNPVPLVQGDPSRLCQVLVNLIVNAGQAISEGDIEHNRVEVTTSFIEAEVIIEIKDTGCGIPQDKLEKIFEPYFTTKPAGEGTGLGMYLSRSYIQLIGGQLEVQSEVGLGTTMRIRLQPTSAQETTSSSALPEPTPVVADTNSRILVVDDEALIRRAFVRALGTNKHVVTASDGQEALEILSCSQPFDLIFTDIMMPGMDGMNLHGHIEKQWPEQAKRMVFMTGGAFGDRTPEFFKTVTNPKVTKNLSLNELRALVHKLEKQFSTTD